MPAGNPMGYMQGGFQPNAMDPNREASIRSALSNRDVEGFRALQANDPRRRRQQGGLQAIGQRMRAQPMGGAPPFNPQPRAAPVNPGGVAPFNPGAFPRNPQPATTDVQRFRGPMLY